MEQCWPSHRKPTTHPHCGDATGRFGPYSSSRPAAGALVPVNARRPPRRHVRRTRTQPHHPRQPPRRRSIPPPRQHSVFGQNPTDRASFFTSRTTVGSPHAFGRHLRSNSVAKRDGNRPIRRSHSASNASRPTSASRLHRVANCSCPRGPMPTASYGAGAGPVPPNARPTCASSYKAARQKDTSRTG